MKRTGLKLIACLLIWVGVISIWEGGKALRKKIRPFKPCLYVGKNGDCVDLVCKFCKKESAVYHFNWYQARAMVHEIERCMNAVANDICYDCVAKYDEIIVETD